MEVTEPGQSPQAAVPWFTFYFPLPNTPPPSWLDRTHTPLLVFKPRCPEACVLLFQSPPVSPVTLSADLESFYQMALSPLPSKAPTSSRAVEYIGLHIGSQLILRGTDRKRHLFPVHRLRLRTSWSPSMMPLFPGSTRSLPLPGESAPGVRH